MTDFLERLGNRLPADPALSFFILQFPVVIGLYFFRDVDLHSLLGLVLVIVIFGYSLAAALVWAMTGKSTTTEHGHNSDEQQQDASTNDDSGTLEGYHNLQMKISYIVVVFGCVCTVPISIGVVDGPTSEILAWAGTGLFLIGFLDMFHYSTFTRDWFGAKTDD